MRTAFGGSDWVDIGYRGRCGRGRHFYLDGKGQLVTDSTAACVSLCQVEINENSLIGPMKFVGGGGYEPDKAASGGIGKPYRHAYVAENCGIERDLAIPLSYLLLDLEDSPTELLTGHAYLLTLDGDGITHRRIPGGFSRHVIGERTHAILTRDGKTTLFVASPPDYDGIEVIVPKRAAFRRYAKKEIIAREEPQEVVDTNSVCPC